jgi:hypothetical protein
MSEERQLPDEVTRELKTTADKIRAMAAAGYDRTEIRKHLGIRPQHVRNVLIRSGGTSGLSGHSVAEREPVLVDVAPVPTQRQATGATTCLYQAPAPSEQPQ